VEKWAVDELALSSILAEASYLYYDCVLQYFRILNEYTKGLIVWPVRTSPLRKPILRNIDKGFEINHLFRAK
jgi:hypothetical protein